MQHYSAGYTNTTNHFVIQNLPSFSKAITEKEKARFALLLRFLQRGLVMPLPLDLAEKFDVEGNFDSINKTENSVPLLPLQLSEKNKYSPKWSFEEKVSTSIEAKAMTLFLRKRLHDYLPEWSFLEFLFWANAPLSEILQQEITETEVQDTNVNFYLPLADLAVLIVSSNEEREKQQKIEQKLRAKGIYVVSFSSEEILEETDLIREKMEWIRHQIEKPVFLHKLRDWNRITTNKPREITIKQIWWKAAIIRIQILSAELLFRGKWKMEDVEWKAIFLMREKEQIPKEILELAIESVQKLVVQLFPTKNNTVENVFPKLKINTVFSETEVEKYTTDNQPKIDFSILHRWTDFDNFDTNPDWINIRNEYAENYRFSFHSDEGKPLSRQLPIISHSFYKNDFYRWSFDTYEDLKRTDFLLNSVSSQNLVQNSAPNQSSFLQILLAKALNGQSVLANLPLQVDASFIFGWLAVLQSSPSLLICTSTDTALDKMEELATNGIDKVTIWHSEMNSQEIKRVQDLVKENKVVLLILTADLLNTKAFVDFISNSDKKDRINWSYFLVDEIHRFSEWSPQHRQEYMALEQIYYNYFCTDSQKTPFVFLSHFLDHSVSKTIQNTFEIKDTNFLGFVSSSDYLENKISNFEFIETENTYSTLVRLLKTTQNETKTQHQSREVTSNTGIIFTSGVDGSTGSYLLSERLEFDLKRKVYSYSVEIPKDSHDDKETHFIKRNYLRNTLKTSQDLLVVSTSALNFGINLENLDFVIQYGLPKSLTELVDISNRTKKKNSKTYIIFQKEDDEKTLLKLFEPTTRLSDIRNMHREVSWLGGDMYRHLLEWATTVELVGEEVEFMKQFYDKYCLHTETENQQNQQENENTITKTAEVDISDLDFRLFSQKVDRKLTVERTIIRFYQMGILSNWECATPISNTKYTIWVKKHDQNTVRKHIFEIIQTYQSDFEIHKDEKYSAIFSRKNYSILEKYCFLFLQWIHENSIYHLKNNLREVYQYAKNQVIENKPDVSIFENSFLNSSSIN